MTLTLTGCAKATPAGFARTGIRPFQNDTSQPCIAVSAGSGRPSAVATFCLRYAAVKRADTIHSHVLKPAPTGAEAEGEAHGCSSCFRYRVVARSILRWRRSREPESSTREPSKLLEREASDYPRCQAPARHPGPHVSRQTERQ